MCMVEETVAVSDDVELLDYACYNYHNLKRAEGKLVRDLRFQVSHSVLVLPSNNRIIKINK